MGKIQIQKANRWLRVHKIKAFYNLVDRLTFSEGVATLLQASGIGKMRPNILLLGYQSEWRTSDVTKSQEYFAAIQHALEMHLAVAILRVEDGLDYSGIIAGFNVTSSDGVDNEAFSQDDANNNNDTEDDNINTMNDTSSVYTVDTVGTVDTIEGKSKTSKQSRLKKKKDRMLNRDPQGNVLPEDVQNGICRFRTKQKNGTIDVWWLYDDGGLSMLLPHILSLRSNWSNSKLRVFCLDDNKADNMKDNMRQLLNKFRIPIQEVIVIPDITAPPSNATKAWFDALTRDLVRKDSDHSDLSSTECYIEESVSANMPPFLL